MIKAMRKGSLLILMAAICAATLTSSPTFVIADQNAWNENDPGGGSTNGDPDQPPPSKPGAARITPRLSGGVTQSYDTGLASTSVTGVNVHGWLQAFWTALRFRLGW